MLFAVLPHATLAASAIHMATVPAAVSGDHHATATASDTRPCHDDGEPAPAATHIMPPCCILGCGLLAVAPQSPAAPRIAQWRTRPSDPDRTGVGAIIEPAERPPRQGAYLSAKSI
ncbi:hypothetical protein [Bosea sp. PAMC 26642]|uniref:hypothetical protein n=1 Tax=Bosea sp. (strain PAMC 26642) TaxID=1792307 RepID=UPI0012E98B2B|nr:hypothetical protein [Bosea sp. PAMC 26642]